MGSGKAILSSFGEYTTFTYNDRTITFLTGKNLYQYTEIKEWDHGYLVVMCRTKSNPEDEREDYIDLIPILENLCIDPERFLKPIKEVEIFYG
jgi:hypothetical protein